MKKYTTSQRLKQLMAKRGLKQIDILNLAIPFCQEYSVKLGRNDLSQYVNGKVEPGQQKLSILGLALNVNEAWLMGYDVPIERTPPKNIIFDANPIENSDISSESFKESLEKLKGSFSEFESSILESFAKNENYLLYFYRELNILGKKEALKRIVELTKISDYTSDNEELYRKEDIV